MRILVVDDQAANRGLLSYLLEEEGHSVIEASTGEEGIRKFEEVTPDLILMDVMMPGMDGYEAVEQIKSKSQQHIPIIFLTALSDDVSLSRCIESGGDDFLTKPVNEVLLNAKIKAHERIRELNTELNDKNVELESLHKVMKQENDLAEYVYETAISQHIACSNIKSYLSPMGGFSGDVIFVERTNRNSLFIMLGDFTGHGLPAALGALPISQQFKFLAQEGVALGDLAEQLNLTLYKYLPGHMFCAANLIELSGDGKQASCWSGGLPDILLIDDNGLIRRVIKSQHMALGVLSPKSFKRDIVDVSLRDNERLIVYSDGITDCCDINGEMLGEARFEQMFDGRTKGDALFDDLVLRVQEFGEGRPQDDDVSILEVVSGDINNKQQEANSTPTPTPTNHFPWDLSTVVDLSIHREVDLVAKFLNLFANRNWLRAKKDVLYHAVLTQVRLLLDEHMLDIDWETLALTEENEARQQERGNALDKLKDAKIYALVRFYPKKHMLAIIISSSELPEKLSFEEYDVRDICGVQIAYIGDENAAPCLITQILTAY